MQPLLASASILVLQTPVTIPWRQLQGINIALRLLSSQFQTLSVIINLILHLSQ